ncbi:unnamed protein product [Lota lota]
MLFWHRALYSGTSTSRQSDADDTRVFRCQVNTGPPMQNPDGAAAASAAQRQQHDQALASATQRDAAKSLALLRKAVLCLAQQTTRGPPNPPHQAWA